MVMATSTWKYRADSSNANGDTVVEPAGDADKAPA